MPTWRTQPPSPPCHCMGCRRPLPANTHLLGTYLSQEMSKLKDRKEGCWCLVQGRCWCLVQGRCKRGWNLRCRDMLQFCSLLYEENKYIFPLMLMLYHVGGFLKLMFVQWSVSRWVDVTRVRTITLEGVLQECQQMAPEWKIYLLSISYLSSIFVLRHKSWITWKDEGQHETSGDVQYFPNILQSSLLIGSPFQHRQCIHHDPQYLGWTHPALLCTYPQSLSIWSAATAPIIL